MRFWIPAALAAYLLFFYRLTGTGLVGPDEPRYAWVAREMARAGDWVTPRLWGEPWFEKSPLLYWMTAAAFRAGLNQDWAPRLPVALLSVAFLVFFYWRMKTEFGFLAAGYAVAVLGTSAGWVAYSHAAVVDLPLTATFGAAMLCLLGWCERREPAGLLPFAALLGLAVLAKGLVGLALAGFTLLVWAARMGAPPLLDFARPRVGLTFAAVAGPWYVLCYARNGPAFVEEFFWRHHFGRYLSGALEHGQPLWFLVPALLAALVPWTPLLAALDAAICWRDRRGYFLSSWALSTLVFFSLSRDKLPGYILPALPALAALAGMAWARQAAPRGLLTLCSALLALMPVAATVLPAALETGLRDALSEARFPLVALAAAGLLVILVGAAEWAGRRRLAFAAVALCTVGGYVVMKQTTFSLIDRRAGARAVWRQAQPHRDSLCLGQVRRHLAYGLHYYAGQRLPECSEASKPYRVEGGQIVSGLGF